MKVNHVIQAVVFAILLTWMITYLTVMEKARDAGSAHYLNVRPYPVYLWRGESHYYKGILWTFHEDGSVTHKRIHD